MGSTDRHSSLELFRKAEGNNHIEFRQGQWEAIDAIINRRERTLVVQRTGWGKSSVYFLATRILRNHKYGPTLIISPLLALIRNQIMTANRYGINAVTINSTNSQYWSEIEEKIFEDKVDVILISPERLSNYEFIENIMPQITDKIGLFVVDEAHCISDWGHDFRPDYRKIVNILRQMPVNVRILGTTATANKRVIKDIKEQLGFVQVQRGPLIRHSLALQNLDLPSQASRMAWLAENIRFIPGSGIIYTLTKRDAENLSTWLQQQGISAYAYYSGVESADDRNSNQYRSDLEEQLLNNKIKALVATTALSMGFDKPDLGFVIHFQAPSSIISYYQQVGRAGRGIDNAYGILMLGNEDEEIHEHFRNNAFPKESWVNTIIDTIGNSDGISIGDLTKQINLKFNQIKGDYILEYPFDAG
ncbi:MAG: RecQ family ATP-dependent DNA helicase [Rhodobacteraceae bacterium]|nr:RecQ family ATP-dependent DNA helicase [Paracoccaceae bacterium]